MRAELRPASRSDRLIFRHLMQLYAYDFSVYEDSDVDEHGLFDEGRLDYYWYEPARHPFLILVDDRLAGFVLVNDYTYLPGSQRSVAEFFVMQKYRRRGVGKGAAFEVFTRLPGRWEVAVMVENSPALAFWQRVIEEYTKGSYRRTHLDNEKWRGPVFSFDNLAGGEKR